MSALQQAIEQLSQNKTYSIPASAPANVRKHLGGNIVADAISVHASIHYTSLSGKDQQREVIIRRLLKSGPHLFMEAFCPIIKEPRLIKVDQIITIEDLVSHYVDNDPIHFIEHRLGISLSPEQPQSPTPAEQTQQEKDFELNGELFTAMRLTRAEMTALMFFARADRELLPEEVDVVIDYVHRRCPHLTFKDADLKNYLVTLAPDPESFNAAIHQIVQKEPWVLQMFIENMMALIARDQKIAPEESELAQQVIALVEKQGFEIEYEKRS